MCNLLCPHYLQVSSSCIMYQVDYHISTPWQMYHAIRAPHSLGHTWYHKRHMTLHLCMTFSFIDVFTLSYSFCVHTFLCHTHASARVCVIDAAHLTSCVSSAFWWYGSQSALSPHLSKRTAGEDMSTVRTVPCICLEPWLISACRRVSGHREAGAQNSGQSPTYCCAFAHHCDSLHLTAELRRCFHG